MEALISAQYRCPECKGELDRVGLNNTIYLKCDEAGSKCSYKGRLFLAPKVTLKEVEIKEK